MGVDRPLRNSGGTRSKQDRGRETGPRPDPWRSLSGEPPEPVQVLPSPEPPPAHRDQFADGFAPPTLEQAPGVGLGRADEGLGFGFLQRAPQGLQPHAGIHQDRHGRDPEQGEGEGEKFRAGRNHQDGSNPGADAETDQAGRQAGAIFLKLGESRRFSALHHRRKIAPRGGQSAQQSGDVPAGRRGVHERELDFRKSRTRGKISTPASSRT